MSIDFEELISTIIKPLVSIPEDIMVKKLSSDDSDHIIITVIVNDSDIGRVIGKGGKIANAIRTLAYAGASKEGKKISIEIESY